jgi:hypothetical protein
MQVQDRNLDAKMSSKAVNWVDFPKLTLST